jgi:hypothetical protein
MSLGQPGLPIERLPLRGACPQFNLTEFQSKAFGGEARNGERYEDLVAPLMRFQIIDASGDIERGRERFADITT